MAISRRLPPAVPQFRSQAHTHSSWKDPKRRLPFSTSAKISVRAEPIYLNEVLKIGKNAPFVTKLFECDVKGFKTSFQVTNLL